MTPPPPPSRANWRNRTVFTGDNLDILRGLNSNSVDLIYLDPPFNSNRNYSAPIGSQAAGAAFKDAWTLSDVDLAWHGEIADREPALYAIIDAAGLAHGKGMKAYLIMMAVRLLELRRVLKANGSIWLHCDPTASHYLKMLLDCVFGKVGYRNEVVWCYTGPSGSKKHFPRKHDVLLYYAASSSHEFHGDAVRLPYKAAFTAARGVHGANKGKGSADRHRQGRIPTDWWADGHLSNVSAWRKERTGYPTQKPLALLERIIKASSNEGDVVLDPFCGCATALVAAERLGRQWVGIDLSPLAVRLVRQRLQKEARVDAGAKGQQSMLGEVVTLKRPLKRTDLGKLPDYRTHKHALYGEQEGACGGCRMHFPFRNLTIDHVVPRDKGGSDHLDNLQLLCAACNSVKGNRDQAYLVARLKEHGVLTLAQA